MSATCDSCGARVIWTLTLKTGRSMPVDELPSEDGNVVLCLEEDGKGPPISRVLSKGEHVDATTARHKSHFATCPNAAQHRRPR